MIPTTFIPWNTNPAEYVIPTDKFALIGVMPMWAFFNFARNKIVSR